MNKYSVEYTCQGYVLDSWQGNELVSPDELNAHLQLQLIKNRVPGYLFTQAAVHVYEFGACISSTPFDPNPA